MMMSLTSSDVQFGFKNCSYAINTLRNIVDYYVNNGTTVSLTKLIPTCCASNDTKPVKLLDVIIVNLCARCSSCVKLISV